MSEPDVLISRDALIEQLTSRGDLVVTMKWVHDMIMAASSVELPRVDLEWEERTVKGIVTTYTDWVDLDNKYAIHQGSNGQWYLDVDSFTRMPRCNSKEDAMQLAGAIEYVRRS